MRLFRLEIKRILKSRRTLIILAIALLLSVAMAYLPISFEGINLSLIHILKGALMDNQRSSL